MSLIRPNTENYTAARAASGSKSMHNGDAVAQALVGLTIEEVKILAESMGVEDVNKYDKLNVGQIRMNLGNRIRGRVSAIDKENAALVAKAESDDATVSDKKAAQKLKSGEEQLESNAKPLRKVADARIAEQEKAKEAAKKEAAAKKAAADKAKEAKASKAA